VARDAPRGYGGHRPQVPCSRGSGAMKTFKRPAAMIAAAVVALATVSPTAALATNGDRGKDRGHEASQRRDHDGDRDDKAGKERRGKHEAEAKYGKHDGKQAKHEAKA